MHAEHDNSITDIVDTDSEHNKRFEVEVENDGTVEQTGYDKLSEAALKYEEILESGDYEEIAIHDLETGDTIISQQG